MIADSSLKDYFNIRYGQGTKEALTDHIREFNHYRKVDDNVY